MPAAKPLFISDLRGTLRSVFGIKPASTSGSPASGTFRKGDLYMDSAASLFRCTVAGTPGTWVEITAGSGSSTILGYLHGARLAYLSATQVTVGTTSVDSKLANSTGTDVISWNGLLTAAITASGANGLDTGSEAASTWYAVYVISGTSGVASLLSLSATAPTLPSGYTLFRRVGWVRNNASSNFVAFSQHGTGKDRTVFYDVDNTGLTALSGGTATAFTTVALSSFVPPTSRNVILSIGYDGAGAGDFLSLRPNGSAMAKATALWRVSTGTNTTATAKSNIMMPTNSSQEIQYIGDTSNTTDIFVAGFIDEL